MSLIYVLLIIYFVFVLCTFSIVISQKLEDYFVIKYEFPLYQVSERHFNSIRSTDKLDCVIKCLKNISCRHCAFTNDPGNNCFLYNNDEIIEKNEFSEDSIIQSSILYTRLFASYKESCSSRICNKKLGLYCSSNKICECQYENFLWSGDRLKCLLFKEFQPLKRLSSCAAKMRHGYTDTINLFSLDQPNNTRKVATWWCSVEFNPCTGFQCGTANNTALCQRRLNGTGIWELGEQSTAQFYKNQNDEIIISYYSNNKMGDGLKRLTYLRCICGDIESFKFVVEKPTLTYVFRTLILLHHVVVQIVVSCQDESEITNEVNK